MERRRRTALGVEEKEGVKGHRMEGKEWEEEEEREKWL